MSATKTNRSSLKSKIHAIWNDAHSLRDDIGGKDYLGKPTSGRITFGAAVKKYGAAAVRKAMEQGQVFAQKLTTWREAGYTIEGRIDARGLRVHLLPGGYDLDGPCHTSVWDFDAAAPEMRLQSNGQQVG